MPQTIHREELEKLRQFNNDLDWFQSHYESLKIKHKGKYVAVKDSQVIDSDKHLHILLHRLREKGFDTSTLVIEYINTQHKIFVL